MKQTIKHAARPAAFLLLTALLLLALNRAFFYHDPSLWSTDVRITRFRELPNDSLDVLFLGSSNFMCGINPLQLWSETGIQSYDDCSRAQTFPFSYEYLKDALETQSPACVVLDTFSVLSDKSCYGLANSDLHFGINMENLSFRSKWELIQSFVPLEDRPYYLFPLLNNHNYYKTWPNDPDETGNIFFGYCFVDEITPYDVPVYTDAVSPMDEAEEQYLQNIIQLCQEQNIDLYVIKTPIASPEEQHSVLNHVKLVCEEYGVDFYDMSSDCIDWGFDYQTDMMDKTHVNRTGASKVTARIGSILREKYDFSLSATHEYAQLWEEENNRMLAFQASLDG